MTHKNNKLFIASYYRQLYADIKIKKIKRLKPVLLAPKDESPG